MKVEEMWFDIYKDGKNTGRSVGILYLNEEQKLKKLQMLKTDYPIEEGYMLKVTFK